MGLFFIDQQFLTTVHKLVHTSSNQFYQSVISYSACVSIAKPIEVTELSEILIGHLSEFS